MIVARSITRVEIIHISCDTEKERDEWINTCGKEGFLLVREYEIKVGATGAILYKAKMQRFLND